MTVSLGQYRRIVAVAAVFLAIIIFTGAAVRLTDSGLGCEDWPTCNGDQVIPEKSFHGWVEFGNRLISIAVSMAVAAAVLVARRLNPERPDLVRLAWGLVVGVVAQILLGAATVRLDLHPLIVSLHFLFSAALMWNVMVLLWRSGQAAGPAMPISELAGHAKIQMGLAVAVLVVGTMVTGSGPNSGDIRAERLDLNLQTVARAHSATAWFFVASLLLLLYRQHMLDRREGTESESRDRAGTQMWGRIVLFLTVAQGGIGYWQYATGVPPLLVEFHVMGATALWCATVWLRLQHLECAARAVDRKAGVGATASVRQT